MYLTCPRERSQMKKHLDVCHQCQDRADCNEYQKWIQPEIDFEPNP